jgi:[acyl-carrier-protein] S-malonyltransferase
LRSEAPDGWIKPNITSGLSLGEYTALYAAGIISFEDGLKLVAKRGKAMQMAADSSDGAMVSILGLDESKVNDLCAEVAHGQLLVPVNFNCPSQIVVSGHKQACQRAADLAEKFGAIKAIVLSVAGAFHTEMMAPAAKALAETISKTKIAEPDGIKIIANVDAQYYTTSENIRQGLVRQLTSPVFWQKSMEQLLADGITDFYEIGPGRVLTGLMRKINRKTKVVNISSFDAVKKILGS